MPEQANTRTTGDRQLNPHEMTTTSAVCRWWQDRLDQELQALLFEGIVEVVHPEDPQSDRVPRLAAADPGALVVEAVPRRPGELSIRPWGDNSELIADWFDQGDCLAEHDLITEDSSNESFGATQEGL